MISAEFGRVLMLSPHLDDAVFGCGIFLHQCGNADVATVFAGTPGNGSVRTDWDSRSGFENARDAMASRREEDRQALSLLHARPVWLDFLDSQYGETPSVAAVAAAISELIAALSPGSILFPAGLFHSDHVLVHRASLQAMPNFSGKSWIMYEEALYRRIPGLLQQRLADLLNENIQATPLDVDAGSHSLATAAKREAISCYASQLRALQGAHQESYGDLFAQERLWGLQALPLREGPAS